MWLAGLAKMMFDVCMQEGWTATMMASRKKNEGALGLLNAASVDLNVQDKVIG